MMAWTVAAVGAIFTIDIAIHLRSYTLDFLVSMPQSMVGIQDASNFKTRLQMS
jgi:hypothetical protein